MVSASMATVVASSVAFHASAIIGRAPLYLTQGCSPLWCPQAPDGPPVPHVVVGPFGYCIVVQCRNALEDGDGLALPGIADRAAIQAGMDGLEGSTRTDALLARC